MTIEEIYEKHTGTNMELQYLATPKENVLAAMQEYADQEVRKAVGILNDAYDELEPMDHAAIGKEDQNAIWKAIHIANEVQDIIGIYLEENNLKRKSE